ncbi:TPA: DUF4406 domain-containing protein [Escherichia coli]
MKIYIAGPMTGYENFNRDAFNKEADRLSRTLAAGFSAPEKRVLLVVPEDADIRPLNGCDVISAKTLHTRVIPVPDVVIIDDVEKCKSVSSTATIKRILRCSTSAVVFRKQLHN